MQQCREASNEGRCVYKSRRRVVYAASDGLRPLPASSPHAPPQGEDLLIYPTHPQHTSTHSLPPRYHQYYWAGTVVLVPARACTGPSEGEANRETFW
jgi:hypothetical protein